MVRGAHPLGVALLAMKSLLRTWIRGRLHGYRELVNQVDPSKPLRGGPARTVAVVGGGLAGIAAASVLGERGFRVHLFERNSYLGGKVGSWTVEFPDGFRARVDHGFHAFFRHYYNLSRFLEETGAGRHLEAIEDYLILSRDGRRYGFAGVETTPVLNILSLMRRGFFSVKEVVFNPRLAGLRALLRFDPRRTFEEWDGVSYDEFAARLGLPGGLKLVFGAFARAFFTPGDRISAAELIKSFHFFYLAHDRGLLYDYFDRDYQEALIGPVTARLSAAGVRVETGTPVESLGRGDGRFVVNGQPFDYVVLAADTAGTRRLAAGSAWLRENAPELHRRLTGLQSSPGYAVLRIWLDRRAGEGWPVFVVTEKQQVLDSVTFHHRFDAGARAWAGKTGGGVYELHCYAVPPELATEAEVREAFLRELHHYLPALGDARVLYEHLQLRRDFTAFDRNLHDERPWYDPGVPNLYLAGDWVKLPVPAMLMEAAFTSGLLSANAVLAANGLREERVWSVPRKGILA